VEKKNKNTGPVFSIDHVTVKEDREKNMKKK
jgi:hypothetical protein